MASSVKKCQSFSQDAAGTTAIKSLSAALYLTEANLTDILQNDVCYNEFLFFAFLNFFSSGRALVDTNVTFFLD